MGLERLALAIEYVNDVLFIALAAVTAWQWRNRRDEPTAWVAATFGVLSTVVVLAMVVPEDGGGTVHTLAVKFLVVMLLSFPYMLYRFAASFHEAGDRTRRPFAWMTAAVVAVTLAIPALPAPGDPREPWVEAYTIAVLLYWTVLSVNVSMRLWKAGRGKPTVARRRMRLLAAGATVLNLGLLLSIAAPSDQSPRNAVIMGLFTTVSALLFISGFATPRLLRTAWRRREEAALSEAQLRLMAATTPAEVVMELLPHGVAVVGARGGALLDDFGCVLGAHGVSVAWATAHIADSDPLRLPLRSGQLVLWAGPHTPYFGRDEVELLQRFGVVIDLAWGRVELLEHLRETTRSLEEAQAIAHLGAWSWDFGADHLVWSTELYRILGLDPGQDPLSLQAYLHMVHADDRQKVGKAIAAALATGESVAMDMRVIRPDYSQRDIHVRVNVQHDERGHPVRLVGTTHDITERKRAEHALSQAFQAERAAREAYERTNAELESFVYSVSHDLKSPVVSLLGYLDYLRKDYGGLLPPVGLHYLDRMNNSATYMDALIQDLLELSRVGRRNAEPEAVPLAELVAEIGDELRLAYPDCTLTVEALPTLLMSPLAARQLFTNLIENALRHGGRPDLEVTVSAHAQPDGSVLVDVADNGIGIPRDHLETVFGVFERLEHQQSDIADAHDRSTGIGLAICRKIVEVVGGSVTAVDVSTGARLRVHFPASAVAHAPAEAAKQKVRAS